MKHARPDYNRIQDPENKIPENEPVFLLRAQDKFAPMIVYMWAAQVRLHGGSLEMAELAENHAKKMILWQSKQGSKIPD